MALYDEEVLGARQQAETARKLREGYKSPEGQMVSGWYVAPSPLQHLAELLKVYTGVEEGKSAQEKLSDIERRKQQDLNKWMEQIPQDTPEQTISIPAREATPVNSKLIADALRGGDGFNPEINEISQDYRNIGKPTNDQTIVSSLLRSDKVEKPTMYSNAKVNLQSPNELYGANSNLTQDIVNKIPAQTQTIPATQASSTDRLKWLQRGNQIDPTNAAMMAKYMEMEQARKAQEELARYTVQTRREDKQDQYRQNESMARLVASLKPQPDKLVQVEGEDGKPRFVPQSQASGMTPYIKPTTGVGTTQQRSQDASDAMKILQEAAPLVNKSTSSGIGNLYDNAMALFGKSTEGADIASQMKVLGGALISKMPKMSGPQSDKDVLLYKEMAGRIGEPTVPASQKVMAMKKIMRLQTFYGNTKELPMNFEPSQQSSGTITQPAQGVKFLGFE